MYDHDQATLLLERLTDGIAIFDREGRFRFVNSRAMAIFRQTREALIGQNFLEICSTVLDAEFCQRYQQSMTTQASDRWQVLVDHLQIWFEVRIHPSIEGTVLSFQDISEYKQHEGILEETCEHLEHRLVRQAVSLQAFKLSLSQELQARRQVEASLEISHVKLAQVLESITDGMVALDREWRFNYINSRAAEIWQVARSRVLGRSIWEVFPHYLNTAIYKQCQRVAQTYQPARLELLEPNLDAWFAYNIYPSEEGISIYFEDITTRKQAEQKAAFVSDFSRTLSMSLDPNITIATAARSLIPFLADYCVVQRIEPNGQMQVILGLHRDDQKQPFVNQLAHAYQQILDASGSYTAQVLRTQVPALIPHLSESWVNETFQAYPHLIEIYQSLCPQSLLIVPLVARGQCLGILLLAMSDSQRQYTQSDLEFATDVACRIAVAIDNALLYEQAQDSNRLKEEFLRAISHELRTPLNAILGWTKLLLRRPIPNSMIQTAIATIDRRTDDLKQLVYDLLDLSQMLTGSLQLEYSQINLVALVQDVISTLHPQLQAKSLHLQQHLEICVDAIEGDRDRLRQLVWHLLSNAVKFTPEQGQITIRLTQVDAYIELMLQDTGQGIDAEFLPYVFDYFRQADGSTIRRYEGLGLGLSLARHISQLHQGTIRVESKGEDQGTTVTVRLPISTLNRFDS